MPAFVSIAGIVFGGASNQVGAFNGQNIQNAWDSHAPNISAAGSSLGQYTVKHVANAILYNNMLIGQPTMDADWKDNGSPQWQGF